MANTVTGAETKVVCCHLHKIEGCCDPEDCGPCCENCTTCPTINGPPPPWDHAIGWVSCPTCQEKCVIRARPPIGSVGGPKVVMVCEVDACRCGWPGSGSIGVGRTRRCWACSGTKLAQDTGGYDRPCGFCNGMGVIQMMSKEDEAYWRAKRAEEQAETMREEAEEADPSILEGY